MAFILKSRSIRAKGRPDFVYFSRALVTRVSRFSTASLQDAEVGASPETLMAPSETRQALHRKKAPRLKAGKIYEQGVGGAEESLHTQISTATATRKAKAKTSAEEYVQGSAACFAATEKKTQLKGVRIIETKIAAMKRTENLRSCTSTSSVPKELAEILGNIDYNTHKYGDRWKQAACKLFEYGIPPTYIIVMLKKCRKVICSVTWVESTLKHFALLGMSHQEMGKAIVRLPTILNVTDSMFKRKIEFFESLGIERHYLGKNAHVTLMAITTNLSTLRTNTAFWNDYMKDVCDDAVCSMMLSNPQLLGYKSFQQKVAWLEGKEFDKKWFLIGSSILSLTLSTLVAKLKMLERLTISSARKRAWMLVVLARVRISKMQARFDNLLAVGFTFHQAQRIVSRAPSVLSSREQNINAKIRFVLSVMNASLDTLASSGRVWTCCLETKIKDRHAVMKRLQSAGVMQRSLSLDYMLGLKEVDFHRKFVEKLQAAEEKVDALGA